MNVADMARWAPTRPCNGGPYAAAWCGQPATVVCTAADGLQWYACDVEAHREGARLEPIGEWFARVFGGST